MIPAGLSLEQAPPYSVPLRFFVSASAFGVAAGVLVACRPSALAMRWSPELLAATHLLLAGFLVSVMLGALQQVLPVVAGAPMLAARAVGSIVHVAWTAGVASLAVGLGAGHRAALVAGAALVLVGGATFLVGATRLATAPGRGATVTALRLAWVAFAIVLALGGVLAAGHAGWIPLHRFTLTDVHVAWALVGWISVLVMGVAFQVVPMLLVTPEYPRWLRLTAAPATVTLVAGWSLAPSGLRTLRHGLALGASLVLSLFAVATLLVLARRRRHVADTTVTLFRVGSVALAGACGVHVLRLAGAGGGSLPVVAGGLHALGFASTVAVGMLLKVVPFLTWFHLQALAGRCMAAGRTPPPVPTMKDVVGDGRARLVASLHVAACAALIVAPVAPAPLGPVAGVLLVLSFGLLGDTIVRAVLVYRRVRRSMVSVEADVS